MKKVIGLGACVYDTLISCGTYPTENTKQKADGIFVSGGGPVGNALVVLSKLEYETDVLGAFADDAAGKFLLEDFARYNVGTSHAKVIPGATSFVSYILLSAENGTRTCVFDRGSVKDDPRNIDYSAIDGADILHLDGNYMHCAIEAAKYARAHGVKVSIDAGGLYAGIEELLPLVDILIPSAEFAMGLTKTDSIPAAMTELQKRYSPEILVVTAGSEGGYYMENGQVKKYDTEDIKVVDSNGAGDTFHGAFLTAYCDGKSIFDCCAFADAVAAYKCTNKGARTYPLSREVMAEFLKTYHKK